ncbi:MAG: magnesium/cobalt transporter CorA [Haloarculaceae archaeon]
MWVRVDAPTDGETRWLRDVFGVDLSVMETDSPRSTRSRCQEYPTHTFLSLQTVADVPPDDERMPDVVSVGLFVGSDWLVTASSRSIDAVADTWQAALTASGGVLDRGVSFTVYRLLDAVADGYFETLQRIEASIERIEEVAVVGPDEGVLTSINAVRRALLVIRGLVLPAREAVGYLARGDAAFVSPVAEADIREVYETLIQLVELTETYRELASGVRDTYMNAVSISTNEVMKRLTAVATIFLPLSFIAAVYGMNFTGGPYNMPELTWRYGYPAILVAMGLLAVLMVAYLRRKEWL